MPAPIQRPTPAFKTKAGWLTPYALACGYMESAGGERDEVTLEALCLDRLTYRVSWWEGNHRKEEHFRLLVMARKAFRQAVSAQSLVTNC